MRTIILFFILFSAKIYAGDLPIQEVRRLYQASASKEEISIQLISILEKNNEHNNPTLAAYKACATMMMAKYVSNPFRKLSYFKGGKQLLEKCVSADYANAEIRYLRLTVQSNAPAFLGYNQFITVDKQFLLHAVSNIKDLVLKQMINSFLKDTK
jgi:hypothetical protein